MVPEVGEQKMRAQVPLGLPHSWGCRCAFPQGKEQGFFSQLWPRVGQPCRLHEAEMVISSYLVDEPHQSFTSSLVDAVEGWWGESTAFLD